MDWSTLTDGELMGRYCSLMGELRLRGVVRSSNNPIADYTEGLVARALNLKLESQSMSGYDAKDVDGVRYQIKGRWLTAENSSTQLSTIRNLDKEPFDLLAAVMYSQDLGVLYSALIPLTLQSIRHTAMATSFCLRRGCWRMPGYRTSLPSLRKHASRLKLPEMKRTCRA